MTTTKTYSWTIFLIFTIINVVFYTLYLYLKYAKNREAVRPYYDDDAKKLRHDSYMYIWYVVLAIWFVSGVIFSEIKLGNRGGEFFIYLFFAINYGFYLLQNSHGIFD